MKKISNIKLMSNAKLRNLKEVLIVYIITIILLLGNWLTINVINYDIMWVYSFAKRFANGYMFYRDYNMVVTPLSIQISGYLMRILGDGLLVYNIISIIITSFIPTLQYLILRKLKFSKKTVAVILFLSITFLFNFVSNSYNIMAYDFLLLLYYIEICKIKYDKYLYITKKEEKFIKTFKIKFTYTTAYNILSGIVLSLIFLSKQNIGIFMILGITLYYFIKSIIFKEISFKNAFKQLTIMAIFCIIPIAIECIYLWINGALYNFIDYCFLGLSSFREKNTHMLTLGIININDTYSFITNVISIATIIIIPIIIIVYKRNLIIKKNKLNINLLILSFFICIVGILFSVPLANDYHIILSKYIILLVTVIILLSFNSIKKYVDNSISKISYYLCIIIPISMGIYFILIYSLYLNKSTLEPYKYTYMKEIDQIDIKAFAVFIEEYEKQNKPIYIITSDSSKYYLVLNKNGGLFELPLYGNLGKEDYNLIINKLKEMEKEMDTFAVFIYDSEDKLFWQEAKEISEYVKQNYVKTADIYGYSLYEYCKESIN